MRILIAVPTVGSLLHARFISELSWTRPFFKIWQDIHKSPRLAQGPKSTNPRWDRGQRSDTKTGRYTYQRDTWTGGGNSFIAESYPTSDAPHHAGVSEGSAVHSHQEDPTLVN